MIDIFLQKDVEKLFKNKNVMFMGDSNIRALYKDFLCIIQHTHFISQKVLQKKMEDVCYGDRLLFHGPRCNGRSYKEERQGIVKDTTVSFYFLTCVYDRYVTSILENIQKKGRGPDVLIINSCLWDVTRWGPGGVENFKRNLTTLMKELKRFLPNCLVIWVTAPPISCEVKGGFLLKELEFLRYSLRFHVMEANSYARKVVVANGFDVVDSHYHLKMQIHRRCDDGIHWFPPAVRYVTNLLFTHISLAWNITLPHRYKPKFSGKDIELDISNSSEQMQENKKKSKIASVVKTTAENVFAENPYKVVSKENVRKKPKRQKKKTPKKKQESHHAYLNRRDQYMRHQRIRQWHSSDYQQTPPREFFNNIYNKPYTRNYDQHDSGYFASPPQMPLYPSSSRISGGMYYPSPSQRLFPPSPHPYQQYSPISPIQHNYGPMHNICSPVSRYQPYQFPNPNEHLKPVIDFSSTNDIHFGIEF